MTHYVGVLDGGGEVWGVRIPDIPGCVGGGETPEAAIADAAEALRDVAAHRRDGGFALPQPSSMTEIMASGEIGEGESAVMVPLLHRLRPNRARQHQPRRRPARGDRRRRQRTRPQPVGLPRQRRAREDHDKRLRMAERDGCRAAELSLCPQRARSATAADEAGRHHRTGRAFENKSATNVITF